MMEILLTIAKVIILMTKILTVNKKIMKVVFIEDKAINLASLIIDKLQEYFHIIIIFIILKYIKIIYEIKYY